MAELERPMKWWGWGDPDHQAAIPEPALAALRTELGAPARDVPVPALDELALPESRLGKKAHSRLAQIVGDAWVRSDRLMRVTHAAGKSYPDLLKMRSGALEHAPDAVVYPADAGEVRDVLEACVDEEVAVVPFGGGTSVVGGVEPLRGGREAVISLDLGRIAHVDSVDRRSLTVVLGAGLRGPAVEAALAGHGLTLGHYPQSWEFATVGGWVATRSAGQASTGYGAIDKLVSGLRCLAPGGDIALQALPASAAGPGLRQFLVGSEGLFGVITEATLKVRPQAAHERYEGWMFHDFEEGAEAFRSLEQRHVIPDVARLSDPAETRLSMTLSDDGSLSRRVGRRYIGARGYDGGCIAILGWEGERRDVDVRRALTGRILRRAGGLPLGTGPGRAWKRGRFAGPYLRDALLDRGVMAETLETAAPWSRLMHLYTAVADALRSALQERGTPGLVMCHISHLYPDGASLYYTFIAPQEVGAEMEQWWAVKSAACDAIVGNGGTITHHHAIGRDHARWMPREIGNTGVDTLRAVKDRLDPAGILNPGKVLP
jgi:alkyldihydroxyacetonephosphate synthase